MFKILRNSFIAGLIIVLPLTITLYVLSFLVSKIGTPVTTLIFQPIFESFGKSMPSTVFMLSLLDICSTFIVVLLIVLIGFFSRFFFGRIIISLSERLIAKIPLARSIYKTVKQIVETFSKQKKTVFQSVVMVEFPRKDMFTIAFTTGNVKGEILAKTNEEYITVFVPTTPNPTGGYLVLVPEKDVVCMDMSVADAMKFIISGGAVVPDWKDFKGIQEESQ